MPNRNDYVTYGLGVITGASLTMLAGLLGLLAFTFRSDPAPPIILLPLAATPTQYSPPTITTSPLPPTATPEPPTTTPTASETLQPTPTQFWPPGVPTRSAPTTTATFNAPQFESLRWWEVPPQMYQSQVASSQTDCRGGGRNVSNRTWLMPAPQHVIGLASFYSPGLMEKQCVYRGIDCYSGQPYVGGVSLMSPADLGKALWLRAPGHVWQGPFVSVDAAARHDFCEIVLSKGETVEVDWQTWQRWGRGASDGGLAGVEVWMGMEKPEVVSSQYPVLYAPMLFWP